MQDNELPTTKKPSDARYPRLPNQTDNWKKGKFDTFILTQFRGVFLLLLLCYLISFYLVSTNFLSVWFSIWWFDVIGAILWDNNKKNKQQHQQHQRRSPKTFVMRMKRTRWQNEIPNIKITNTEQKHTIDMPNGIHVTRWIWLEFGSAQLVCCVNICVCFFVSISLPLSLSTIALLIFRSLPLYDVRLSFNSGVFVFIFFLLDFILNSFLYGDDRQKHAKHECAYRSWKKQCDNNRSEKS